MKRSSRKRKVQQIDSDSSGDDEKEATGKQVTSKVVQLSCPDPKDAQEKAVPEPKAPMPRPHTAYNAKLNQMLHRQRQAKRKSFEERNTKAEEPMEEKREKPNLLGNIIGAQAVMFKEKAATAKATAAFTIEQKNVDPAHCQHYGEYNGEVIQEVAQPLTPEDLMQQPHGNVSYRMWNLRRKESSQQNGGDIKVMVRCKTHAIRQEMKSRHQTYTVSTKMERLADYGAEAVTRSEIAREWISTMVRPGSKLLRLRVDAVNSAGRAQETRDLKQLTKDGFAVNFQPAEQLGYLHTLFGSLVKLQPGQYVMRHNKQTGPFVKLERAVGESESKGSRGGCYDFFSAYNSVHANDDMPESSIPAVNKLDFGVLLPWQKEEKRVPGMFQPKDAQKFSPGNGRGRGRGRGVRGWRGQQKGAGRGGEGIDIPDIDPSAIPGNGRGRGRGRGRGVRGWRGRQKGAGRGGGEEGTDVPDMDLSAI